MRKLHGFLRKASEKLRAISPPRKIAPVLLTASHWPPIIGVLFREPSGSRRTSCGAAHALSPNILASRFVSKVPELIGTPTAWCEHFEREYTEQFWCQIGARLYPPCFSAFRRRPAGKRPGNNPKTGDSRFDVPFFRRSDGLIWLCVEV